MSGNYLARVFAAFFFLAAIAGLVFMLLMYSGQMTEVLKGIVLVLIGGLGQQAGVAFGRLADPDPAQISKQERINAELQAEVLAIRSELAAVNAAYAARDGEQRRVISDLLDRLDPNSKPKLIEDKS